MTTASTAALLDRSLESLLQRRPGYVIQVKVVLGNPPDSVVQSGTTVFVCAIVVFRAQLPSHEIAVFKANHFLAADFCWDFDGIVVFIIRIEVAKDFVLAYL